MQHFSGLDRLGGGGVNISHHFEMLGTIFNLNQNSFVQQKNVIAQTGQLHSNIIGPFCSFYHFCVKTFSNVFPELKVEDQIIIYDTNVIL